MKNREIKFRAWNKAAKVMTTLSRLSELPLKTETEYVIIEQFTGEKDKDGKYIYEGDIVNIEKWLNNHVVIYSDAMFQYQNDTTQYYLSEFVSSGIRIVGNIHGQPQLMLPKT